MRRIAGIVGPLAALLASGGVTLVHAEEIYKSIDENGVVQYSTIPPSGDQPVESLNTLPEPSEADIEAARQRLERINQSTREIQERRVAREEDAALEASGESQPPDLTGENVLPKLAPLPSVGF